MPIASAAPANQSLAELCQRIDDISTLPHVVLQALQVASDPNSGAREIKAVMESDVALSTRVLRVVNSSGYGLRMKITKVQDAIAYLGMQQIRNLATTASVSHFFQADQQIGPYDRKQLWRHMVAVGVCARLTAMRMRKEQFEDVFLAGLLHDIGIILEDQHDHARFASMVQSLAEGESFLAGEQRYLGFDHTQVGESVARSWKLPNGIMDSIRWHHNPFGYKGQYIDTVRSVELADFICSAKGISSTGVPLGNFPKATIAALGLTKEDIVVLAQDLDRELVKNEALLHV